MQPIQRMLPGGESPAITCGAVQLFLIPPNSLGHSIETNPPDRQQGEVQNLPPQKDGHSIKINLLGRLNATREF